MKEKRSSSDGPSLPSAAAALDSAHNFINSSISSHELRNMIGREKIKISTTRDEIRMIKDKINAMGIDESSKKMDDTFVTSVQRSEVDRSYEDAEDGPTAASIRSIDALSEYEIKSHLQTKLREEIASIGRDGGRSLKEEGFLGGGRSSSREDLSGEDSTQVNVGNIVVHDTKGIATVRYAGTAETLGPGVWYGLELHGAKLVSVRPGEQQWLGQGLGDGSLLVDGVWKRYFRCKPGHALFVRREHISGTDNATTVLASSHRLRTQDVCLRLGSKGMAPLLQTGSLAESSVVCVTIPEDYTFQSLQDSVVGIVGGDPGMVAIEVWGHPVTLVDTKTHFKSKAAVKTSADTGGVSGNYYYHDDDDNASKRMDIVFGESRNIVVASSKRGAIRENILPPQVIPHKPKDKVCEFLRNVCPPQGPFAAWNSSKSHLPTMALVTRSTDPTQARFWVTHPLHLETLFTWILCSDAAVQDDRQTHDNDDPSELIDALVNESYGVPSSSSASSSFRKSEKRQLNFEQFRVLMSILRSSSKGSSEAQQDLEQNVHGKRNYSIYSTDFLLNRFKGNVQNVRAQLDAATSSISKRAMLYEDYHLFRAFGSTAHQRLLESHGNEDREEEEEEEDNYSDEEGVRGEETDDLETRMEGGAFAAAKTIEGDTTATFEAIADGIDSAKNKKANDGLYDVEDKEVMEMYLNSVKDPSERAKLAEKYQRIVETKKERREILRRASRHRATRPVKLSARRRRKLETLSVDIEQFKQLLRLWVRNEEKSMEQVDLGNFYATIRLSLEDTMQFEHFLMGLKSIAPDVDDDGARLLFRQIDFKKRGYVTYQQMDEFWDVVTTCLRDKKSMIFLKDPSAKNQIELPSFMRHKERGKIYLPLSAQKKHGTRKLCWLIVLLGLWVTTFGIYSSFVQSSYGIKKQLHKTFVDDYFIDSLQTNEFSEDVHIQYANIATEKQVFDYINGVIVPFFATYGSYATTDNTTMYARLSQKNLNAYIAGPMTFRQLRVNPSDNCDTGQLYQDDQACVGPYMKKYRRNPFGASGTATAVNASGIDCTSLSTLSPANATKCAVSDGWTFYEPSLNEGYAKVQGRVSSKYDFSGYRISLDPSIEYDFEATETYLTGSEWFDGYTAALIIHIPLFYSNVRLLEDVFLILEWSPLGVIAPSYKFVSAEITNQLETYVDKILVATYCWLAIYLFFVFHRLGKRGLAYSNPGSVVLDSTLLLCFVLGMCFHFNVYLSQHLTDLLDLSSYDELYDYLAAREQTSLIINRKQSHAKTVEVVMMTITFMHCALSVAILSRKSTLAIVGRSLWGSNLIEILGFYVIFLFLMLMVVLVAHTFLGEHVETFSSVSSSYMEIFSYIFQQLSIAKLDILRYTGVPYGFSFIPTFIVSAIAALRLFVLPIFRAIVAHNYIHEMKEIRAKTSSRKHKHRAIQYFEAIIDLFGKRRKRPFGGSSSRSEMVRKLRSADSAEVPSTKEGEGGRDKLKDE